MTNTEVVFYIFSMQINLRMAKMKKVEEKWKGSEVVKAKYMHTYVYVDSLNKSFEQNDWK